MATATLDTCVRVPYTDSDDQKGCIEQLTVEQKAMSALSDPGTLVAYTIRDTAHGRVLEVPKNWGLRNLGLLGAASIDDQQFRAAALEDEDVASTIAQLRPHQVQATDAILRAFRSDVHGGGALLVLPCGFGKTVTALHVVAQMRMRCLIVCHTDVLVTQWAAAIAQYFPNARVGKIQQNIFEVEGKTHIIASLKSLAVREYDMQSAGCGVMVVDECLPHHQDVLTEDGPRKIGQLYRSWKSGDALPHVASLNEGTGTIEFKEITWAFKKRNDRLLSIKCGTSELQCTPNHLVLTANGYIAAGSLREGDHVTGNMTTDLKNGMRAGTMVIDSIVAIANASEGGAVFDLEVRDNHNFVTCSRGACVGPVVHNCHHIAALQLSRAVANAGCRYRLGLSATPNRADGLSDFLDWSIGNVVYEVKRPPADDLRAYAIILDDGPVYLKTIRKGGKPVSNIAGMINLLTDMSNARADMRQRVAAAWILLCASKGRKIIILSDRICLLRDLDKRVKDSVTTGFMIGAAKKAERAAAGEAQVVFASYGVAAEGLDLPHLDTILFATPRSGENVVTQCVGRIQRGGGRKPPLVIDIVDGVSLFQNMFKKRCKVYKRLGAKLTKYDEMRNIIP